MSRRLVLLTCYLVVMAVSTLDPHGYLITVSACTSTDMGMFTPI